MASSYDSFAYNTAVDSAFQPAHWPGIPSPLMLRVRSDEEDDNTLRRRMLGVHCISDLDDQARETADMAFGRRNRSITSADNYMDVGRALCATYELEKNPHQMILSHGEELGIRLPDKWETNQDLYAAIGEQFATRKRSEYNEAMAKAEAAAKARQQELGQLAQSGLEKFMEGNADQITAEEHEGINACGIRKESLEKARAACWQYLMGRNASLDPQALKALDSQLLSLVYPEIDGPRSIQVLTGMADTIGDDAFALDLTMQYIHRRTLEEERDRRSGAIAGNLGSLQSGVQHILSVADEYANDTVGILAFTPVNIKDSIFDENVHWYDALGINPSVRQNRRNSFIATARQAHAEALAQAQSENPHILDAVSGTAVSVANAGKWFLPGKWLKAGAVVSTLMENERTAAMKEYAANKDLSFKEYDFWDAVGTPALKTGITAGTFKAVGAINGAVGGAAAGMWGKTASSNAQQLAAKIMQNKVAGYAGHSLTAAVTMEEISGMEWMLNLLADNTIVSDTQNTSKEQGEAIIKGWTTSDGLTEKALTALVFGAFAIPGMVNKAQYEKWKSTMGMTPEQSKRYDAAKNTNERRAILEEMRAADPSGFKARAAKAGEQVVSQAEMEALSKAGIEDYILKEAGYTKSTLPDGRFELTRKTIDADGKEVEEKRTYTQEQLNDYYATKHESLTFRAMVEMQSRARGEKLAAAAERINTPFLKIISLDKLDPSLISTLQDGQVTKATIRALAEKARAEIDAWTARFREQGKDETAARTAAEQQTMGESGVSLKTLSHIDKDFDTRTAIGRAAKTIGKGKEAATAAFLMPRSLGELTLALTRGEVREHEILHDLIESRIRLSLAKDPTAAAAKMKEALQRVDADLRRRLGKDAGILPLNLKGDISELELVEAMSHLATADFLAFHGNMELSAETHAALETARSIMGDLQTISTLATAWKAYAATAKGKEALSANSNLLRDILEQSKAYVRDVYAEAEKQATKEAADIIHSYDLRRQQERQKLMDDYKASRAPLTEEQLKQQPESTKHPEAVSAQDSITGEKIPAEKFYEAESVNQETGEIIPPAGAGAPQTDAQGKGKGLVNGTYHEGENGHLYGAAEVGKIKVSARYNHDRARQNIDRYDPATAPVLVFRDKQGNLTAIGNLGRLELMRGRGNNLVDVEIVDESKAFTADHAADTAMEYAMRTDNATPTEILDYFTRHEVKRATVYERGLIPPTVSGELPPAAQIAWNLHENGTPKLKKLLKDGTFDVETATRIADMAPGDADTQAYIIKLKQSKRNFKWATIEKKALKYSTDRFNAFVEKNRADSTTSFSMREYRERKPLEELLREKRVSDLIQRSRAVARQFSAALELEGITDTQVQEHLGRVVGLHAALRKECGKNPRMRQGVESDLTRAEMRLRAMVDIVQGKTDSTNIKCLPAEVQKAAREAEDKLKFVCDYFRRSVRLVAK